ncbi:MAG: GNAT family N-acetyltransferase [Streptosporangiales bacterium]|nr:GNAT family N-acetyltransferase [Streptosporangiales bacterium]
MREWLVELTEGPVGLRPLRVRDARTWRDVRLRNDHWLAPWEATLPAGAALEASRHGYTALARALLREAKHGYSLPWVVTYDGEFAGQLTIGSIAWGSACAGQAGYWIDQRFAGRGVTPTALALAVDHCFGVVGLHRIEANIRPENERSRRVVEKLGFREEGLRRRFLHINGQWCDHLCYALTVEDAPNGVLSRWRATKRELPHA